MSRPRVHELRALQLATGYKAMILSKISETASSYLRLSYCRQTEDQQEEEGWMNFRFHKLTFLRREILARVEARFLPHAAAERI
jgi:hypothetical protein